MMPVLIMCTGQWALDLGLQAQIGPSDANNLLGHLQSHGDSQRHDEADPQSPYVGSCAVADVLDPVHQVNDPTLLWVRARV